jgi:hypothetical protein
MSCKISDSINTIMPCTSVRTITLSQHVSAAKKPGSRARLYMMMTLPHIQTHIAHAHEKMENGLLFVAASPVSIFDRQIESLS